MPANEIHLALQQALDRVETAGGEVVLDFSAVRRIDPAALQMLEKLSSAAAGKTVSVALRGVNVDVYKALKLMQLAHLAAH